MRRSFFSEREQLQGGYKRREFIRQIAKASFTIAAGASIIHPKAHASPTLPQSSDDFIFSSAVALASAIRKKQISSEEAVKACLRRIERVNAALNAVCARDDEASLRAARLADKSLARGDSIGLFHGVPVTIKDSLDTVGLVSTGGTTGRQGFIPPSDSAAVNRLRRAGAIIVGKTNTPELTLSYETDNLIYGRTQNPYDLTRTPGGSSGGSAAILAVGGPNLELGSDTAGSIRVPASFCGIAGLKPTSGRVPRSGHIIPTGGPIGEWTQIGPMSRQVEDLFPTLSIIAGPDDEDPNIVPAPLGNPAAVDLKSLRVGFFLESSKGKASEVLCNAVSNSAKSLEGLVLSVESKQPPSFGEAEAILAVLNLGDGGDYYRHLLQHYNTQRMSPPLAGFLQRARNSALSGRKYADALCDWSDLKQDIMKFSRMVDIYLCPVASGAAPIHGGTNAMDFSFSYFFNVLGWPSAVVRVGTTSDGLPIGLQIAGKPWKEDQVLAVALQLEKTFWGWKKDFPEKHFSLASG